MKILIVDDSPANRLLLANILQKDGHHDLTTAASAEQAYAALGLGHPASTPAEVDLILMDIVMPGVDGIEACRRIKAEQALRDVPVIMVTANTDVASLQAAFAAGAMDYITKPVDRLELLARVRSALSLKQETDRRKSREMEIIQIGASIQQTLLLGHVPRHLSGVQLAARAIASELIDGDFYDFFQHGQDVLDVVVADVMGKGVPAALLGAATKAHVMRAVTRLAATCALTDPGDLPEPKDIVGEVHANITAELIRLGAFVTLCYARIDLARQQVSIVDAGHCKTVHYHRDSGTCSLIHGTNMPLGFDLQEVYTQVTRPLCPGDLLVFYSDGITESRNAEGETFGTDRLMACVEAGAGMTCQDLIASILATAARFSGTDTPADDRTCVALGIGTAHPDPVRHRISLPATLKAMAGLRHFIHGFCQKIRAGDEAFAFCLELAVQELAVNIVRHGRPGPQDQPRIKVEAFCHGNRAVVQLLYRGRAFQGPVVTCLPCDKSHGGGYGLYIVNHCTEAVVYSRRSDGLNCITVTKAASLNCLDETPQRRQTHGI